MGNIRGNLTLALITMFFVVSTLFGLMHYWNVASGINDEVPGLENKDSDRILTNDDQDKGLFSKITGIFTSGFIDYIANALSWLSPFALVKVIVLAFTEHTPEVYTFVDYFFLRPIGWIIFFIQFEWVAYYVRGKGF